MTFTIQSLSVPVVDANSLATILSRYDDVFRQWFGGPREHVGTMMHEALILNQPRCPPRRT